MQFSRLKNGLEFADNPRVAEVLEPSPLAGDDVRPQPVVEHERAQQFQKGMARLSAHDREILVLRHYQELSYKEIASTLSLPEGTVMSRLFHARRRLRENLPSSLLADLEPEYRDNVLREADFDPIRNHPHFLALTSVIV